MLTLDDGHDSALLDSGGTLETVSVDALDPKISLLCPKLVAIYGAVFSPRRSSDLRFISSKESTVSS